MDHRELLKKYIRWVEACEGSTFISRAPGTVTYDGDTVCLSSEEAAELEALEVEAFAELKHEANK